MVQTNMRSTRVKPLHSELIVLHVLRTQRLSPSFVRVTLGGGDIDNFAPLGFDQWFRLFIPVHGGNLERLPGKLDIIAYTRYLSISKATRPVLRNYSVSGWRAVGTEGAELDIDFVIHGSAEGESSGPAAGWAQHCVPGDAVALIDEGITFTPAQGIEHIRLVADETGLPATGNILATLARSAPTITGEVIVEVPHPEDRLPLTAPEGVNIHWVVRDDTHAVPGTAALAAARQLPSPVTRAYGWAVGESALPIAMRRHWLSQGFAKHDILFCGYWKAARH